MTAITCYPSTCCRSRATRAGGFLFLSGQIPMDADGKVVRGDIREQTHAAIARIATRWRWPMPAWPTWCA